MAIYKKGKIALNLINGQYEASKEDILGEIEYEASIFYLESILKLIVTMTLNVKIIITGVKIVEVYRYKKGSD